MDKTYNYNELIFCILFIGIAFSATFIIHSIRQSKYLDKLEKNQKLKKRKLDLLKAWMKF